MAKTMKKLDSKLHKQQQGWRKISNTARKYYKDENLENYDSEIQMYARAYSGPWLANWTPLSPITITYHRCLFSLSLEINNFDFSLNIVIFRAFGH